MDNTSIVKYLLVALAAPLWLPVLRALWVEVNRMLVEDGGVFGRPPSAKEAEALREDLAGLPDSLVHEPFARQHQARAGAPKSEAGGPLSTPRRAGFR